MHAPSASSAAAEATADNRDDLIVKHLPLVHHIAFRLSYLAQYSTILEPADLVGFGVEGLIAAVDSFDPTRGTSFSTWAAYRIRGAILDRVRELDPVPRSLRDRRSAIERARAELLALLPDRERQVLGDHYLRGRALPEIATAMGVTRARVSQLHMAGRRRLLARFAGAARASGAPHCAA